MERLLDILRTLRAPDGCPWDREQTHDSLRPQMLEEAAEAVDALGGGDDADVREELGDVLLQVAFHAVIAEERGRFDYPAVERAVVDKLVRRHPHVFGDATAADADEVKVHWNAAKARERGGERAPSERVPRALPALSRAAALDEALGWSLDPELGRRSLDDVEDDGEALGAALVHLAQRARRAGHDPEVLLRDAVNARSERDRS